MTRLRPSRAWTALSCAWLLSSCLVQDRPPVEASVPLPAEGSANSGGSGDGNQNDANDTRAAGAASRPICSGLGNWDAQAAQFEAEVLLLVNAARAQGATCGNDRKASAPALRSDAKLDCVARSFAKAMAEEDFFSHTGLDGSSPFDRIKTAYPTYRAAAENIAAGQTSAQDVVTGWLESPGHCQNIMGNYTLLGIGMYNFVWVQNFVRL